MPSRSETFPIGITPQRMQSPEVVSLRLCPFLVETPSKSTLTPFLGLVLGSWNPPSIAAGVSSMKLRLRAVCCRVAAVL